MSTWSKRVPLCLLLGIVWSPELVRAQSGAWALTNVRIETVTKGRIDNGTIVIRDGIIEAVGARVSIPSDARVVDLANRTVYPGFIDLTSTIGLPTPPARPTVNPFQGGGGAPDTTRRNIGLEPSRLVANELRPAAAAVQAARDRGITAALVAPDRGVFRGLSALIPLRDDTATRWIVRSPVAEHIGYERVAGQYPGSLLGVIAYQRQALYDAQRHALLVGRSAGAARGAARPSYDSDLDALVPVVKRELPAFIAASSENEIRRAVALGKEFDLELSIVGATEGFRAIDALKGTGTTVVSVNFPQPTTVTGWSYRGAVRRELEDSATRSAAAKSDRRNASSLHSAGSLCPCLRRLRPAEFITNVKSHCGGLPRQTAVEALTIGRLRLQECRNSSAASRWGRSPTCWS
jgi:hypothetical protein